MAKTMKEIRKEMRDETERQKYERLDKEVKSREDKLKRFSKGPRTYEKTFKSATKMYKVKPQLSKTLLSYGAGFAGQGTQRVQAGPGRPAGVLKHRSPFTGKPIPAPQFYKEMRAFKRVQAQQADVVQQQQQRQFAKQGVAPNQISNIVEQRMRQQFVQQQMQQQQRPVQQMPQRFPQQPQQVSVMNRGLVGRRVPSKLKFINQIENGTYQGYQPFQQKWW